MDSNPNPDQFPLNIGDAKAYMQLLEEMTPRIRRMERRNRSFMAAN
jgi:hypothetical protein